jgi:hypothetical protein
VEKEEAKFAYHMSGLNWEIMTYRRKISHICAVFIAYCGERAWKGYRGQIGTALIYEQGRS